MNEMIFLSKESDENIEKYRNYLKIVSSLSDLFSESKLPFLHYRAAENIFCKTFDALNHSRGDIAYDAKKYQFGIGIKTFVLSGISKMEKVAEFNSHSAILNSLKGEDKLAKLIELRNERIKLADRICETSQRLYHCIGRTEGKLRIFETSYDLIDQSSVKLLSESDKVLIFKDKYNHYSFNISKSTVFKKFVIPESTLDVEVEILNNPLEFLEEILYQKRDFSQENEVSKLKEKDSIAILKETKEDDYVILPLYSPSIKSKGGEPVPEKSQLNQWNAGGRSRDDGEVYISIPIAVHQKRPSFFPDKDQQFDLILPSGSILKSKVCQDRNKALMTNPNNALAEWLLRKVLKLNKKELLTYARLHEFGIDSVRVSRINQLVYKIEFSKEGSYENFIGSAM